MEMNANKAYIFFIICCVVLWAWEIKSCNDREDLVAASQFKDSTWYYKDKYGKEHARTESLVAEHAIMKADLERLSDELGISKGKIRGVKTIKVSGSDTFKLKDSVYIDKWNTIKIISMDSVYVAIRDTFQIVDYWDRKWLFARKKYYVDVKNSNPLLKIEKVTSREIRVATPHFIIGPSVQYSLNKGLYPGISIIYYPFSLKF
jgi:hypothetical protein